MLIRYSNGHSEYTTLPPKELAALMADKVAASISDALIFGGYWAQEDREIPLQELGGAISRLQDGEKIEFRAFISMLDEESQAIITIEKDGRK